MIDYTDAPGRYPAIDRPRRRPQTTRGEVLAQREAEVRVGHRLPASQTATFETFAPEWMERSRARRLQPKSIEAAIGESTAP
jgi:hypothetical protein